MNPSSVRHGWKINKIDQNDSIAKVTFENGRVEEYDLVVIAEGINSHSRSLVFGDLPQTYSGMSGWALWIDEPSFDTTLVQEYWGQNGFCGIYPAKGKLCAFLATHRPAHLPDPADKRIATIREAFKDFEGMPEHFLSKISNPDEIFHIDFFDIKTPEWVNKRVVMIGDAAHAVLPTGGVGATLAMESASVLVDELSRADSKYLNFALNNYVARRRKRVDRIQAESRSYGKVMFLQNPVAVALRNWLFSISGSKALFKYWENLFTEVI